MNIVFDIGGSRMRFAKVLDEEHISEPFVVKTPDSYIASISEFKKAIDFLSGGERVENLIGGIAGVLNEEKTQLLISPNLKDWENKPLHRDILRMTGAKNIIIKNDTDINGLGEAIFGAGKGYKIVAYLTFSTGIGGSLIINGEIAPYKFGFEPGFQIIDFENIKSLHDFSGMALKEKYDNKLFKEIKDEKIRNQILKALAIGIHNTIVFWSPDIVVIGGGMIEGFKLEEIEEIFKNIELNLPETPEMSFAKLGQFGDQSGLYGALELSSKM
jgi:predicted NBD/HSP70 family sugar kinase